MDKEKIHELISKNKLKEALNLILETDDISLKKDASQISGRLEELKRKVNLGIISNVEATIERNQISNALIESVFSKENTDFKTKVFLETSNWSSQLSYILLLLFIGLLCLIYFFLAPKIILFPIILGSVVFVIKEFLKYSKQSDPIIQPILRKIKVNIPDVYSYYEEKNQGENISLLSQNIKVKETLTNKELEILENTLKRQSLSNLYIISISSLLLIIGLFLYSNQLNRPEPFNIDNIYIQNTDSLSTNILVDLDPIEATWTSTGLDEEVYAVLENVKTGQQSERIRVQASEGKVVFESNKYDNYDGILDNRIPLQYNRIRAIIYGTNKSFKSKEFKVKVGVRMYVFANLPNTITFWATVDNQRVSNYHYLPKISLFEDHKFNGRITLAGNEMSSIHQLVVPNPEKINPETYILTYENKQDDRIVRSEIDLSEFHKLKK